MTFRRQGEEENRLVTMVVSTSIFLFFVYGVLSTVVLYKTTLVLQNTSNQTQQQFEDITEILEDWEFIGDAYIE